MEMILAKNVESAKKHCEYAISSQSDEPNSRKRLCSKKTSIVAGNELWRPLVCMFFVP